MNLQVVGCSHHATAIGVRERLAFGREQAGEALTEWRSAFRDVEGVLLSTCNRVEIYAASQSGAVPNVDQIGVFLAQLHRLDPGEIVPHLFVNTDEAAVRHLFSVAASLDSMVLGEPQILAQVKQAYQAATEREATGPLLHQTFQAAIRVARRVGTETAIHQRRVSIPSVAVADFARQIFERFDDKETLVIGAGEMAEETLRYLRDEGARKITVINRSFQRACERAAEWNGRTGPGTSCTRPFPPPTWSSARRRRPGDCHRRGVPRSPRRAGDRGRCSCWTSPCPAISNPKWQTSPKYTCIRSMICRRRARTIDFCATGSCPLPRGSSNRRPATSWARCITVPRPR